MLPKPDSCRPCRYYGTGHGFVPDRIVPDSPLTLVFRNPGADEEAGRRMTGWRGRERVYEACPPEPLIGATGYALDQKYLPLTGLSREAVSLCNTIRCRPDGDELPPAWQIREVIAYCQDTYFRPPDSTRLFLAAGEHALYALTGLGQKGEGDAEGWTLRSWRGWLHPYSPCQARPRWQYRAVWTPTPHEVPVLGTYHLAALFHSAWLQPLAMRDWRKIGEVLAGRWPLAPPHIENTPPTHWPALGAADTEYVPRTGTFIRYSLAYRQHHQSRVHVVEASEARPLPSDGQSTMVYHHAEADLPHLDSLMPPGTGLEDTMLLHALLHPDLPHDLNTLGSLYSTHNRWKHLAETAPIVYAGLDAWATLQAYEALRHELEADPRLKRLYYTVRLPLVRLIRQARSRPTKVNQATVKAVLSHLEAIKEDAHTMAQAVSGWPVKLSSPQQVGAALYGTGRPHMTIAADRLRAQRTRLLTAGKAVPPLLEARLHWTEAEGVARYLRAIVGRESVCPRMLPTQACARWSTTDPPLVNFPRSLPLVIMPWPGHWFLKFDLAAIESRVAAASAGDQEDLDIFARGWDLHTLTACLIYERPEPPDPIDPHGAVSCEAWRQSWSPPWRGREDLRRVIAKNIRYGTTYSFDRSGKSILAQKDIERSGATREQLVSAARTFLVRKTALWEYKQQVARECVRTGVAWTTHGARRRLYGDDREKAKLGWNFMVQAWVSDTMNTLLLEMQRVWPESRLATNRHDGAEIEFPLTSPPDVVYPRAKALIEREWEINGHRFISQADWCWIDEAGGKRPFASGH